MHRTFIVMNLNQLTNEQQRAVINVQMQGNVFFDHLLSLGEVRHESRMPIMKLVQIDDEGED